MSIETRAPLHDELSDELNAFLDEQLDLARAAQVAEHVAACAECARELEELRATRALVQALPPLRAPRTFMLPAPEPVEPRWQRLLGWGWRLGSAATAACVLLAALATNGRAPTAMFGAGSTTSVAKTEVPAQQAAPPAQAPQPAQAPAQAPQAAHERSALAARDSAPAGGTAAGARASIVPAPAQASPVADTRVPARRSLATPWIIAALLLGVVSAYAYTLDRRARAT